MAFRRIIDSENKNDLFRLITLAVERDSEFWRAWQIAWAPVSREPIIDSVTSRAEREGDCISGLALAQPDRTLIIASGGWPNLEPHLLELAGRDALEVEDRDQHLEALGAARVGRQDGRSIPDAPPVAARLPIVHTRLTHRNRADASHDLALGKMSVAHQTLAAIARLEFGVLAAEFRHFRLDRPHKQRTRAVAQNFGERIGEGPWLGELKNGKYPPAEPGALEREPLEAAVGSLTRPQFLGHLKVAD